MLKKVGDFDRILLAYRDALELYGLRLLAHGRRIFAKAVSVALESLQVLEVTATFATIGIYYLVHWFHCIICRIVFVGHVHGERH